MLKRIIKRDGSTEDFDPIKVNKWAEWASEEIKDRIDWGMIVMHAVRSLGEEATSQQLQTRLIKECVQMKSWPYSLMAGRLYASLTSKQMYPDGVPTVQDFQAQMVQKDLMRTMDYSDEDYAAIEEIVDHKRDHSYAYFQIKQNLKKYGLSDEVKGINYESSQFMFARMAMALAEDEHTDERLFHLKNWYSHFSKGQINSPSPNYRNLGTDHNGYASCCLYATDDTAPSIAAGNHIAEVMTYMSAGIGGVINCRSKGDPVRGGAIIHKGKWSYFNNASAAVNGHTQGGRGGSATEYSLAFDPEQSMIARLQNPLTTPDLQIRGIHFAMMHNRLIAKKVAKNEDIFQFNVFTAPDLYEAALGGDKDYFEALYNKYEKDPSFVKTYVNARRLIIEAYIQRNEVATYYTLQIDEANRHTPHKQLVRSSNLCVEITQPTNPYRSTSHLYIDAAVGFIVIKSNKAEKPVRLGWSDLLKLIRGDKEITTWAGDLRVGDTIKSVNFTPCIHTVLEIVEKQAEPEVSTCSLAGLVVSNIHSDEEYESAAYYAAKMIDKCIDMSHYELPHIGYTAKNRRNAGIGILGLATHMARKGLKYDTPEGLAEIDRVMERHAYFCIKAALRLGQEKGNAPWMHKTKWPEGWLPIDTYKPQVDELVKRPYTYDWETLRAQIIANGGIRFSSVISLMPTESSSKSSGAPNGPYPIRDLNLKKTDHSLSLDWVAPDNDILADMYQLAWEISTIDQIKFYAVMQKWCDQSISADFYRDRVKYPEISEDDLIEEYLAIVKYGVKSQYYANSYTGDSVDINEIKSLHTQPQEAVAAAEEVKQPEPVKVAEGMTAAVEDELAEFGVAKRAEQRGCVSGVCTL
jgi:ribonucleoside-diphosphate reductase alpha chain